ncbi:hypothetical protein COEREDRAFT_88892 [Coemansia reversa NRRL 1564]|uniref:Uncharacterized protein n=1 Tax=Coemansia reversa (strain ATCC 12441 / NRRL 1564) TaxID=763665 RepID=A0A2G5B5A2_COERN|nr:hypothetical protein COEREDRAFT_88892 [Coemansia reversa NRRL 1564]|eukprot:PIA14223.1 hypothetical protein COEREDRAFT_88892 [Coemansia reversa NRRL 1564]
MSTIYFSENKLKNNFTFIAVCRRWRELAKHAVYSRYVSARESKAVMLSLHKEDELFTNPLLRLKKQYRELSHRMSIQYYTRQLLFLRNLIYLDSARKTSLDKLNLSRSQINRKAIYMKFGTESELLTKGSSESFNKRIREKDPINGTYLMFKRYPSVKHIVRIMSTIARTPEPYCIPWFSITHLEICASLKFDDVLELSVFMPALKNLAVKGIQIHKGSLDAEPHTPAELKENWCFDPAEDEYIHMDTKTIINYLNYSDDDNNFKDYAHGLLYKYCLPSNSEITSLSLEYSGKSSYSCIMWTSRISIALFSAYNLLSIKCAKYAYVSCNGKSSIVYR